MLTVVMQLPSYIWWSAIVYALVTGLFILLENKSSEKTLAWLLAFLLLPVIGVVIYLMFGRDYHPFSRQRRLLQQELGASLRTSEAVAEFMAQQPAEIERLKQNGPLVYQRAIELISRNLRTPLYIYNHLEILQNASEKYPRLMADLKAAQHYIHMEYFEWASDEVMESFKTVLIERAQAGVEVRLVYDPLGCYFMLKQNYVHAMNAGGVKMIPCSSLFAIHTLSYRSHRKIVVIDGLIGYTGGLNMSEEYVKGPHDGRFTGWRDTHARVTGQVVLGLQASFAVQWFNTTQEHLTDLKYFPLPKEKLDYLPIQIVNSGPDAAWKAIRSVYFALITAAQHHIYIQSPFFILDEGFTEALAGAARAGVDVKIMIAPRGGGGDFPYWAGYTFAENVAEAGAHIYFYEGDYFHVKSICIDSIICSIGSANMDIRSFNINYELNLVIYDAKTTQELEDDFKEDLKKCVPFNRKAYRRKNVFSRTRDSFFRLFSPLL